MHDPANAATGDLPGEARAILEEELALEHAQRAFSALGRVPAVRLVLDGRFSFEPGIDVTDIDSAKGLEFDYVVVPDATASAFPDTLDARRRLHVAVTRAAHQLWLLAGGEGSPLLPEG